MTTGKTIALTRWTFVDEVIFLLFNMLSRLVIAFLLRSKRLFNFMAAVTMCLMRRTDLFEKTLMLGKIEGGKTRG